MQRRIPSRYALIAVAAICQNLAHAKDTALEQRLMRLPPLLQTSKEANLRLLGKRAEFEKSYDLFIRYTEGTIYNPSTATYDKVNLRAYQRKADKGWDAQDGNGSRFMAPTVVMEPGQTVRFRLYNQLPELPESQCQKAGINAPGQPGCFNVTNLHSHGLWVSPSGNSDNVLLSINPNVNFEYEYNVPLDHPAGTFWYHPHQHGSTAMQVASGMAGALVVQGDRYPTREHNGDLDTLLKSFRPVGGSSAEIMLLQQIPYDCLSDNQTKINWNCRPGETGVVENFGQVGPPGIWVKSGRHTSLNGQVQPVIDLTQHQVYRWRLIDAGFQAPVVFHIKHASDPAKLAAYLTRPKAGTVGPEQKGDENIAELCNGPDVMQFEVASDGLTHARIIGKTLNTLQPGYRSDILFALPKAGSYCVIGDNSVADVNGNTASARLLGVIRAKPNAHPAAYAKAGLSQSEFMQKALINAAQGIPSTRIEPEVRQRVIADLTDGMRLSKFTPHKNFTAEELAKLDSGKKEYVTFNIAPADGTTSPTLFMVMGDPALNQKPAEKFAYQPDRIDHTLILGDQQMWELTSKLGNHPFHIHVNPFQVVSIENHNPGQARDDIDPQYKDLVGTWKDTLFVMQGYKIRVATRYQRYIGEYVLHCHILEHEDQGMMQNVKVVLPDGRGGAAAMGHGHHH